MDSQNRVTLRGAETAKGVLLVLRFLENRLDKLDLICAAQGRADGDLE